MPTIPDNAFHVSHLALNELDRMRRYFEIRRDEVRAHLAQLVNDFSIVQTLNAQLAKMLQTIAKARRGDPVALLEASLMLEMLESDAETATQYEATL